MEEIFNGKTCIKHLGNGVLKVYRKFICDNEMYIETLIVDLKEIASSILNNKEDIGNISYTIEKKI